jgi:hypothetical protein
MKRLFGSLLILAAACALAQEKPPVVNTPVEPPRQATNPPAAPVQTDNENARHARELLDQMIHALGGDAYLTYSTRNEVGRSFRFFHGEPSGTGVQYWRFWKYPDMDRMEMTKQRDWIVIYKGDHAWEMTFRGTANMDPDELKLYLLGREYSNEWVLRRWLNAPGTSLFYDGQTIAEQRPAEKVTVMDAQNRGVSYFISTDTHLPVKKSYNVRDPKTGDRDEWSETYDNYRLIQGIQTPLSWTWYRNDQMTRQRFLNTVSYNAALPDSDFDAGPVNYNPLKK